MQLLGSQGDEEPYSESLTEREKNSNMMSDKEQRAYRNEREVSEKEGKGERERQTYKKRSYESEGEQDR